MQARIYEFLKNSYCELLISENEKEALLAKDVASFLGYESFLLPDFRAKKGSDLRVYKEELFDLLSSLNAFYFSDSKKKILISPIRTLLTPLPKRELFDRLKISFADDIDQKSLKDKLYRWGYSFVDIVEERGEVSFRGDILDIYPINSENPYRISFFDTEVESIRIFECESQKSIKEEIEEVEIIPAYFALKEDEFKEIEKKCANFDSDSFFKDIASLGLWVLGDKSESYLERFDAKLISPMENEIEEIFSYEMEDNALKNRFLSVPVLPEAKSYKDIEPADINSFLTYHKNKDITIIAKNEAILKRISLNKEIKYKTIFRDLIVNVLSDKEVVVSLNKREKKRRKKRSALLLDELRIGDYVVHETHGIGIFKGLTQTTVLGAKRDFVTISYQGEDQLLIPVENLDSIDRYIGDKGSLVTVDKLGKSSFIKQKAKAEAKLFEIAKEIVEIAAKRELSKGFEIRSGFEEIEIFQKSAGFEYTEDQKRAIEEIFSELESGKVMDRLLSADVGFGKTEVAMNAILAVKLSGYQSAFIVPTTLLSAQHYKTLKERLSPFGVKIAKLDRFTSAKEKREILKGLKEGEIDVCIGTHALLGVEFKNLAFVVIDEEHKFGVKQKEKLKALRTDVHILSMSATPIPRSLNMALSSIKSYSQILTPPQERQDVRTFVKEYDEKLIKEVILREKRRGGQIFYIHNRIASIDDKKREIETIVPGIKVLVLHSKITASVTEKELLKFENGEYDVLLSTSIVESGIHLPNVNTIIVEGAENFGIADLHQLRGRVGRSKRQGYCYFLVEDKDSLSDISKKRLIALESNSYLGSGSVLAYHDLEIRGGGNIVGEAQSGHIKNIGYSLYLRMLEESVNKLLNKTPIRKKEVDIKLSVSAFINSEYISEDRLRLELYRRLSRCESVEEVYEIEDEMIDRFGKPDVLTKQFLDIITLKILAIKREIKSLSNYKENITIVYENGEKIYLKARSKDDDDILNTLLSFLRKS